jgi:hypothetical protein
MGKSLITTDCMQTFLTRSAYVTHINISYYFYCELLFDISSNTVGRCTWRERQLEFLNCITALQLHDALLPVINIAFPNKAGNLPPSPTAFLKPPGSDQWVRSPFTAWSSQRSKLNYNVTYINLHSITFHYITKFGYLLQEATAIQFVKKLSPFHGSGRFIRIITANFHGLFHESHDSSTHQHTLFLLTLSSIFFSHLHLFFRRALFLSDAIRILARISPKASYIEPRFDDPCMWWIA